VLVDAADKKVELVRLGARAHPLADIEPFFVLQIGGAGGQQDLVDPRDDAIGILLEGARQIAGGLDRGVLGIAALLHQRQQETDPDQPDAGADGNDFGQQHDGTAVAGAAGQPAAGIREPAEAPAPGHKPPRRRLIDSPGVRRTPLCERHEPPSRAEGDIWVENDKEWLRTASDHACRRPAEVPSHRSAA
jgi:hypothetical protein